MHTNLKYPFVFFLLQKFCYNLDSLSEKINFEIIFWEGWTLFHQKHTKGYVLVQILGSKSNSKPLFTYSKCLTMAVARTQRHYCNKCHLKRPKCICKKTVNEINNS